MVAVQSFIGGRDVARDLASYRQRGGNLIVGTPGRLHELLVRGAAGADPLPCRSVELLVLDEADRLLAEGFRNQLDALMGRVPKQRRTGLFSATQTREVKSLARVGMRNPVVIAVKVRRKEEGPDAAPGQGGGAGSVETPATLSNHYRILPHSRKMEALGAFLAERPNAKVICYLSTCACVEYAAKALPIGAPAVAAAGVAVYPLHGQMPLQRRRRLFRDFSARAGGACLLCTDVAARGLDVPDVDWVMQLDPPTNPKTFVHRIGRTARMGRSGNSLTFLTPSEASYVAFLRLQGVTITRWEAGDGLDMDAESGDGAADGDDDGDDDGGADGDATVVNTKGRVRFRLPRARGLREKLKSKRQAKLRREAAASRPPTVVGERSASPFVAAVRRSLAVDRELMDAATRGFVTWVRAYRDHDLRYIFRLQRVDVVDLAHTFGLLRFPKMPELAHCVGARPNVDDDVARVNPATVAHSDPAKERRRQERRRALLERAKQRRERMSGRNARRDDVKNDGGLGVRARRHEWRRMEIDELNEEARLMKRLRQGKISKEEYARRTGEDEIALAMLSTKEKAKRRRVDKALADRRVTEGDKGSTPVEGNDGGGTIAPPTQPPIAAANGIDGGSTGGRGPRLAPSGKAPLAFINLIKRKLGKPVTA